MKKKVVVIFSGGMDSGTLLLEAIGNPEYDEVYAFSVNYGQRHSKELVYAKAVCRCYSIPHQVVDLSNLREILGASALTADIPVPHGHYEDETMRQTVVPNRNAILISLAVGYAVTIGASIILIGVHAGDHAIYPDCREEFISFMRSTILAGNYNSIYLRAPYINKSKTEIALIGKQLRIDYGIFWTCYEGGVKACGKCGACQERKEAMAITGAVDTMGYEV